MSTYAPPGVDVGLSPVGAGATLLLGKQQFAAEESQVRRTQVLHTLEHQRVGCQQCRYADRRQEHQHRIAQHDTEHGSEAAAQAGLAGAGQDAKRPCSGQY